MIENINKKRIFAAVVLLLILVIVFAVFRHRHIRGFSLKRIDDFIRSYGSWSIAVYLLIAVVRPLAVILPVTVMTLIAGGLYGPVYGFLLAMASTLLSANVAFLISRYLGKSFIEKQLKGRAEKLNLQTEKNGFRIILVMRVSGIFPLDIVSYAAGLTKMKYRDFILATIIGTMPETFSVAYMGHHIKNPFSPQFIIAVLLVIATAVVPLIYNKRKSKQKMK